MTTKNSNLAEVSRSLVRQASLSLLSHRRYPSRFCDTEELFTSEEQTNITQEDKIIKKFLYRLEGLQSDRKRLSNNLSGKKKKLDRIRQQIQQVENGDWSVIEEWEKEFIDEEKEKLRNWSIKAFGEKNGDDYRWIENQGDLEIAKLDINILKWEESKRREFFFEQADFFDYFTPENETKVLYGRSLYPEIENLVDQFGSSKEELWDMAWNTNSNHITYYWADSYWAEFYAYKFTNRDAAFEIYERGYKDTNSVFYTISNTSDEEKTK